MPTLRWVQCRQARPNTKNPPRIQPRGAAGQGDKAGFRPLPVRTIQRAILVLRVTATGSVCAEPADCGGNFVVYRTAAAFVGGARSGSILKHYEQREALLLIETGHGEACHLLSISERSATLPSASPLIIRSIALSTTGDDRPLAGVMPRCVASGAAATCE